MNISKNIPRVCLAVLAVATALVSIIAISTRAAEVERLASAYVLSAIDSRLESALAAINAFPGSAGKDLLFLKTLTRAEDLQTFIGGNGAYKELLLFDKNDVCTMKIEHDQSGGTACGEVADTILEALEHTKELGNSVVHISPLVLYDGTPALYYTTTRAGGGMIVSIIDADYFLEEIRRLTRDGELVYLLSRDGGYLANPNRMQEQLVGGKANFYRDFASVPDGALDNTDLRRFETESRIFTFWRIFPSASNFAIYEGSNMLYGKEYADEHFWVMAAVSEKPQLREWWQKPSYCMAVSLIVLINFVLIALLFLTNRRAP